MTDLYQAEKTFTSILVLFFCVMLFSNSLSAQNSWQSKLVQMDTLTGELKYYEDTVSGIRIPDFSRAGYKGGGVALPNVAVKLSIGSVAGDNTLHIQNAIDSVSSLPLDAQGFRGALFLEPGVYRVSGSLAIRTSGVILRGAGKDNDSLTNTIILGLGNTPADRSIIKMGGPSNTIFSGMVSGTKTNITSQIVRVGEKKFRVADSSPFQEGDNIIIYHPCTQKWLNAINGGGTATDESWTVNSQPIIYNTRIEKIQCDTIFTNSPIFNTLDNSLSQSYIYKYNRGGLVENIGLENLRIDIEYNTSDPDDDNHAKRAVLLTQVENAWVKGCEFLHFWYAGVDMQTANYVTVQDCNAFSPKGPTTGGYKYNFCVSRASQNTLFTNCKASEGRHAFVSNGTSSVAGVVFHKCTSIDPFTSSEGHRRWTTGLLFDNFIDKGNNPGRVLGLYNRGRYGTGHGWSSANSVAWNCDARRSGVDGQILIQRPPTAQNFAIGCKGVVTGNGPFNHPTGYIERPNSLDSLVPHSLYEAQLFSRNYTDSIKNTVIVDAQCACDSYTWIDDVTYYTSTNAPQFTLLDANGSDSIVTLNLTLYAVDTLVTQRSDTLMADLTGASYQWLNCDSDLSRITGKTGQSYVPSQDGNYAVEITQNGCVDTSACYTLMTLGMIEQEDANSLTIYPNPAEDFIQLTLDGDHAHRVKFYNSLGEVVLDTAVRDRQKIDLSTLSSGVYFLVLEKDGRRLKKKILKL